MHHLTQSNRWGYSSPVTEKNVAGFDSLNLQGANEAAPSWLAAFLLHSMASPMGGSCGKAQALQGPCTLSVNPHDSAHPFDRGLAVNQSLTRIAMNTSTNPSIAPDLSIVDGQITTTSLQIAEHFGKRHDTVLRAIDNLECSAEYRVRNFAESSVKGEMPNGGTRTYRTFRITRDGFTFLAMGFTGKEAARWKEAYITAFNKMEAELSKQANSTNPALSYNRINPAQAQALKELVQQIFEAGIQKYGETWARFHNKFKVNSYLELPASKFPQAVEYLTNKLDIKALPKGTFFEHRRFVVSFLSGREHIHPLDLDDAILKYDDLPKLIVDLGNPLENELLAAIAQACIERMANRLAKQPKQIPLGV